MVYGHPKKGTVVATPDFVLELRRYVGNAPLWMPGCTAVVVRPCGDESLNWDAPIDPASVEILVVRRADNGAWTPVTGIIDPGEEPAVAAEREILEEADVRARALRVLSTEVVGPVTYDNGDVTTYLDIALLCEWVSGEPSPVDGENTRAEFVRGDALPAMNARFTRTVARALSGERAADFRSSDSALSH